MPEAGQDPETPRLPAKIFLSYARVDSELAEWLRDGLRKAGASVFMDTHEIQGGARWQEEIDRELWQRQFLVALVTRHSVAPERQWVRYEQLRALQLLKPVIPCLFEDGEAFLAAGLLPDFLRPFNVVAFAPDREKGLSALIDAIRSRLRRYGSKLRDEAAGIEHAFIGREEDLKRLDQMIRERTLRPTGRQVIGIVGMGGLGKTMLAEELLRRLAYDYPGGVLIESRAGGAASAAGVLRRWVENALGKPPERIYTDAEVRSLLAIFGELLVLLDDVSERDFLETQALLRALPVDATRIVTTRSQDVCIGLGALTYELEAEALLRQALEIGRNEAKSPRGLAGILGMLAALLAGQPGRRAEARDFAREAVSIAEEHRLRQVFGGRRIAELQGLLATLEDLAPA